VREVSILGEEYLDRDHRVKMDPEIGAKVRVLLHIQRRDIFAMELSFAGVSEFRLLTSDQTDPAECFKVGSGTLRFEISSIAVVARTCAVRLLGHEVLGPDGRLPLTP